MNLFIRKIIYPAFLAILLASCGGGGETGTTIAPGPSPAVCASQTFSWTINGNTCSANVGSANSGQSVTASDVAGSPVGSAVYSCTNGVWSGPTGASCAPPPVPGASVTYYFSDCQTGAQAGCVAGNNSNAGTSSSAPKQNLSGINVNTLGAGSHLLFARGGSWNHTTLRLVNLNTSAANPLTFDAYGSGPAPLLRLTQANFGFEFSEWESPVVHGGYVFRNLKLDGENSGSHAFFLRGAVNGVVIEDVEITRFAIGINAQGSGPIRNITLRNSRLVLNTSMGMLGAYNDSLIEGNTFEANNASGSGFNHGTYLSGHGAGVQNVVLRNNRYLRNSVVSGGVCTGGNMTFHGILDNVLIEGNVIEQDAATEGCWLMSITQGYNTAEGFTHFVVRNNRLINGGNTAIAVQSAPGIVVENNVIINTQNTPQTAISVGHNEYQNGDVPDGNAVVQNNTACYPTPHAYSSVVRVVAPNSTVTNNVMVTGAAATTGVCAR